MPFFNPDATQILTQWREICSFSLSRPGSEAGNGPGVAYVTRSWRVLRQVMWLSHHCHPQMGDPAARTWRGTDRWSSALVERTSLPPRPSYGLTITSAYSAHHQNGTINADFTNNHIYSLDTTVCVLRRVILLRSTLFWEVTTFCLRPPKHTCKSAPLKLKCVGL